ncbi:transposase [Nonomuraea angiospora]|uniref:transposase n=1 Tax=Nonomuraea angiospora TaxID=46172 RepID=UPI003422C2F6
MGRSRRWSGGWPYSAIAALETGRTSWTAVLDAVRLRPDDDEAAVTAAQTRDLVIRLIGAGHWSEGDPAILIVFDAGYGIPRLAYLLADRWSHRVIADRTAACAAQSVRRSTPSMMRP